jgi:hypothetical protein
MMRRTSKRVKEVVDKMRLPVIVRLSTRFWDDTCNGTAAEKLKFVMSQFVVVTERWLITNFSCAVGDVYLHNLK